MKQQIFYEEFDSFYFYSGNSKNWEMKGYHFHKEYEVILFLSDGASIFVGNRSYTVENGDLFLIPARQYHKTAGIPGKDYSRMVLMFDPDPVKKVEEALGYCFTAYFENQSEEFVHKIHLSGKKLKETIGLLKQIESSYHEKKSAFARAAVILKILELLLHLNRLYDFFIRLDDGEKEEIFLENQTTVCASERIVQIKRYIEEHVDEKLELEHIASHFHLNRDYLSHYFKKETGFTLGQFIAGRKMERAKVLLKQGFSVTETAVALSYFSDSHFINTFKKMTGTTPKKYCSEKQG